MNKYTKFSVKIRTYNKYRDIINLRIISEFGDYDISEITTNMIKDYILKLINQGNLINNKPLSVNTIYGVISVLKQGFNLAIEMELIIKNPILRIKLPRVIEKEVLALSRDEQKIIENFCLSNLKSNYTRYYYFIIYRY